MPPWIERNPLTDVDRLPARPLEPLDGDQVAKDYHQDWAAGKQYPLIKFPSGLSREWLAQPEPQVHIFGALDLPYRSSRDEAYAAAASVKDQFSIPFEVNREGENALVIINRLSQRGYRVLYNNEQRQLANIHRFPEAAMELLPDELRAVLPPIYHNEPMGDQAYAPLKFFTPAGSWTWYASEYDGDDTFFGLVSGLELEYGYFSLSELEGVRGPLGLPIERDVYFVPKPLQEIEAYENQIRGR